MPLHIAPYLDPERAYTSVDEIVSDLLPQPHFAYVDDIQTLTYAELERADKDPKFLPPDSERTPLLAKLLSGLHQQYVDMMGHLRSSDLRTLLTGETVEKNRLEPEALEKL